MRTSPWIIGAVGLLLVAALPLLRHWVRRAPADGHCALDGMAIHPLYRVRIRDAQGEDHEFCCIRCAELWLGRQQAKPQAIYVTDEASGREIRAASAYFVRSAVVTTPTTGNRVHAFAHRADAIRHADVVRGQLLQDAERPFPP